jgi:hypothetical protein
VSTRGFRLVGSQQAAHLPEASDERRHRPSEAWRSKGLASGPIPHEPWDMLLRWPCSEAAPMNFLTLHLEDELPNCRSCGHKPRLICKLLDPKSGKTVRIFMCACGEVSKTAREPQ